MRASPPFVQAMLDDEVKVAGDKVYVVHDGKATRRRQRRRRRRCPKRAEDVTNNNRDARRARGRAGRRCALLSPDLARARAARSTISPRRRSTKAQLPLIEKAFAAETDAGI